jgi:hypothetical protein
MGEVESLPGRPLKPVEVEALREADGIERVKAVAVHPEMGGAIVVVLVKESAMVFVGYFPDRRVWEVFERRDRERKG